YPEAEIDVVVEPRAKGAYRVCKSVESVIPYDFKDRNSLADWGNLLGVIRDREYDIALSLGQRSTVGLLLWLTGIPVRVGYGKTASWFLTNPVTLKPEQYAAQMYHDLLQGLGITTPCPELAINVPKKDIEWANAEQKRLGIGENGYLLIHGGSSQLAKDKGLDKIYPGDRWQQVIQNLQQKQPDLSIVVLQGPDDREFVATLLATAPNVKVTSPDDVGKLAATIANANLLLCTDSAPMHLGVAVKTPTIALFGPTDPAKLLPQSDRYIAIKSPTGKMSDIAPQAILDKLLGN
ncbi:MAG: glycosyltransferase family 9 protein, partial [Desertifilum sp. SIO1I2]|nr:glycosyltransferase family 9 protein [Desertifilum sp. SIO1I2]